MTSRISENLLVGVVGASAGAITSAIFNNLLKSGPNLPIVEISASAKTDDGVGTKLLAGRTLSPVDFKGEDEYQDFPLYFEVLTEEREFELRVYSKGHPRIVTLDFVQVSRRIF